MKSAHLKSVSLCMFLSSEPGKTYLFKFCTDTLLVKPVCLIKEGDMMAGWVGARVWSLKVGKNMCLIYTHNLTWQRSVLTT